MEGSRREDDGGAVLPTHAGIEVLPDAVAVDLVPQLLRSLVHLFVLRERHHPRKVRLGNLPWLRSPRYPRIRGRSSRRYLKLGGCCASGSVTGVMSSATSVAARQARPATGAAACCPA